MKPQYKLLVAADDPELRDALVATLQADGYALLTAPTGRAAVELAITEQPDLLILDPGMPPEHGHQVIRELRSRPGTRAMAIIVLAAPADREWVAASFAHGADDCLAKPFVPAHLRARVQTWLLRRTASA